MDLVKDAFISQVDPHTQYGELHEKYRYKLAELAQQFAEDARCLPSIYEDHFLTVCESDNILKSFEVYIEIHGRIQLENNRLLCRKLHDNCTCYEHAICFEIALNSSELQCDYELTVEYFQDIVHYDRITVSFGPPVRTWEEFHCYTEPSQKDIVKSALYSAINAVFFL